MYLNKKQIPGTIPNINVTTTTNTSLTTYNFYNGSS